MNSDLVNEDNEEVSLSKVSYILILNNSSLRNLLGILHG